MRRYLSSKIYRDVMALNPHILDEVNLKIIDVLGKDASTPFVEVAKQIGISDATVH